MHRLLGLLVLLALSTAALAVKREQQAAPLADEHLPAAAVLWSSLCSSLLFYAALRRCAALQEEGPTAGTLSLSHVASCGCPHSSPATLFPVSCNLLSLSMLQQAHALPGQGPIPQQCMDTGLALQTACAEEMQKAGAALGVGTGNGVAVGGQASAVEQKKLDAFIADPKNDPSPA